MKNAVLFHCMGGSPEMFWYPWLKQELEQRGYVVWVPELPNAEKPSLEEWLPIALKYDSFNSETVLIGHSAGCPLVLSILENINIKINQAILVAAFTEPLTQGEPEPILQDTYDWTKIKENLGELFVINSDNDPWGCDVPAGQKLINNLGGTLIVPHNQGHMGSTSYNQPYLKFPLLSKIID